MSRKKHASTAKGTVAHRVKPMPNTTPVDTVINPPSIGTGVNPVGPVAMTNSMPVAVSPPPTKRTRAVSRAAAPKAKTKGRGRSASSRGAYHGGHERSGGGKMGMGSRY